MAIQYVGGNTGKWAWAVYGTNTVSLTALTGGIASSASAGDFVVAAYATGSVADRTLSITDGTNAYTLVASELYVYSTTDTNLRVAYKRLTGADASVTFGPTGRATDAGAAAVHVWRGVDPTNPLDVAAVTAVSYLIHSGKPNPAAITPTTTGAVIIAVGGAAAGTGAVFTSSDLSNFRTETSAGAYDAMIGIGSYAWTSGAFDPAQFGGGTTGTGDSWAAVTLALRPELMQYTMPSASGSFQATGQDASTLCGRVVQSDSGAFNFTGFDIDMRKGNALVAVGGSVEAAGSNAITAYGRLFSVEPSAYSVSFDDAGFIRNCRITLERGQFASYGEVAELFTGIFAIVLERTFKVKFEARQFSAENITSSLPVKDENRVFVVPKSSRTFAASSTGGDI